MGRETSQMAFRLLMCLDFAVPRLCGGSDDGRARGVIGMTFLYIFSFRPSGAHTRVTHQNCLGEFFIYLSVGAYMVTKVKTNYPRALAVSSPHIVEPAIVLDTMLLGNYYIISIGLRLSEDRVVSRDDHTVIW